MKCLNCGYKVKRNDSYCLNCGHEIKVNYNENYTDNNKDKLLAIIITIVSAISLIIAKFVGETNILQIILILISLISSRFGIKYSKRNNQKILKIINHILSIISIIYLIITIYLYIAWFRIRRQIIDLWN